MSMLTRKGTMVRKKRRGSGRQSQPPRGSASLPPPAAASTSKSEPQISALISAVRAHDEEKSLCQSDWSRDLSMDQPSYGSIMLQIKEANTEAEGSCEFLSKAMEIIQNSFTVTVLLGMLTVLPVTMISIGVKYLYECPKEPKIPIYLLVGGCFGMVKLLSLLWKQMKSRRYELLDEIDYSDEDNGDPVMSRSSRFTDIILSLFLLIWFGFGNYWILGVWKPNFEQILHEPSNWCDKTLYLFSFGQLLFCYGIALIVLMLLFLIWCLHRFTTFFDKS